MIEPSDPAIQKAMEALLVVEPKMAKRALDAAYPIDMPRVEAEAKADRTADIVEMLRDMNYTVIANFIEKQYKADPVCGCCTGKCECYGNECTCPE